MTLTDFLLARIAEDEEEAQAASNEAAPPWSTTTEIYPDVAYVANVVGELWETEQSAAFSVPKPVAIHMARHDPARVLAECEAKRRIVKECVQSIAAWPAADSDLGFEAILEALALPYADHPDYREEWRP